MSDYEIWEGGALRLVSKTLSAAEAWCRTRLEYHPSANPEIRFRGAPVAITRGGLLNPVVK